MTRNVGTFLLRFSDSELGGVTIAFKQQNQFDAHPTVSSLYPFSTRDLSQRSMADTVFDIKNLTTLYPDVDKELLRKFCSPANQGAAAQPTANGYVRHQLVTQVEGAPEQTPDYGNPSSVGLTPSYIGAGEWPNEVGDVDMPDFNQPIDVSELLDFANFAAAADSVSTVQDQPTF